jgi:hypothetical protein
MNWNATRTRVANRGIPPTDFLTDLAETIKGMPDFLFAPRPDDSGETDIYTAVKPELGPWESLQHRKAAMCEVLRVDAGFESSWRMTEGADASNPAENNDETRSSGLWQVSYNSRGFGADLRGLLVANHIQNGADFQRRMKTDLNFAVLYTVSLLRHSIRWAGPIKRGEINHWLSRAAVAEWQEALG